MHDPECETLAAHFLQPDMIRPSVERRFTYDQAIDTLAEAIQTAVEAWFHDAESPVRDLCDCEQGDTTGDLAMHASDCALRVLREQRR
jgi:hypothetical protein